MEKVCIFCERTWIVSRKNKAKNYTCPQCEGLLRTLKGKTVLKNKLKHGSVPV